MSEEEQTSAGEEAVEEAAPALTAEEELAAAKAEAQDYLRSWQRTQADFINYKRRMEQERSELEQFAGAEAIKAVLPVLDDLDRAIGALPNDGAGEGTWASGIVQIVRKLQNALAQQGVSAIEAVGKEFDPAEHEAVAQLPAGPEMDGKVIAEASRGYRLKGRVLRPAQVVVGRAGD